MSSYRFACSVAAIATMLAITHPALADQFKQAADGGTIGCAVSARELTRFSLVGDQFASVSKISSGYPYNDFAVSNEPVRGDIYVSVPGSYAANRISFFATTRKGFVYKLSCSVDGIEAAQVFITNPAIPKGDAERWERQTPIEQTALRLIQAMAGDASLDGFEVSQAAQAPVRAGDVELQLIAEYRGAALAGKVVRLANRGARPVTLAEHDLAPADTLAVAVLQPTLAPGQATTAYLVGANGESSND